MSSELSVVYEQGLSVKLNLEPEQVIAEARKAAVALQNIIAGKKNPVIFNKEQYIEREDWGMVAKFYGCTAKVIETRYVEFGDVRGWEATAICLDSRQNEISRAESMCLNDEENWGMVAEYDWVDKLDEDGKKIWDKGLRNGKGGYVRERVKTGEKAKPLFQLRSMAQTRAEAKVLKSVFGYVVVLAGYKPSVAEEMTGNEQPRNDGDPQEEQKKPPVGEVKRASDVVQEEIKGVITGARLAATGALWCQVDGKVLAINESRVADEMVNGALLTVTAKKMYSENVGEYWGVNHVINCETVVEGDTSEDESQDVGDGGETATDGHVEEEKKPEPVDEKKAAVAESLKTVFEGGTVKTARQVGEEAAAKKEKAWKAHVGHDPAKHISYKQGMLLFTITGSKGLNISDELVKEFLTDVIDAQGHRYLIKKEDFPKVLDTLDPQFKFHEKK